MKQSDIFTSFEGDQWFQRNIAAIENQKNFRDVEFLIDFFKRNSLSGIRILEIGCSGGKKLDMIGKSIQAELYGIEPSQLAVNYCRKNYEHINIIQGTADNIPWESGYFDVIIFGFCLYVLDRELLDKASSEANRLLKKNGFLVINDFDPGCIIEKKYHHVEGMKTFKDDYSNIFKSMNYFLVEKTSYNHSSAAFTSDIDERLSIQILVK